ncbi:MAG: biotin--[acetyl-CoA-carboxylase] ligase [Eubacteriales bacterium]
MSTKSKILKMLEENRGKILSGQSIADELTISRNSVWKAIKTLQKEGFEIISKDNSGYLLEPSSNKLTKEGIEACLSGKYKNLSIVFFEEIDSTNEEAKRLIASSCAEPTIIVAGSQSKGKGRLGRKFFSPAESGIYMSIAFAPNIPLSKNSLMTTAAAVATCRAIESVSTICAKIKWVNDIFCAEKKIAGILTEGITKLETGELEWGIIGIGVNCFNPQFGFPDEIKETASSISGNATRSFNRNLLVAKIIDEFFDIWTCKDSSNFINEYKERSFLIGKNIYVIKNPANPSIQIQAKAISICDDGSLLVEYENKTRENLIAGEVSLKL